MMNDATRHLIDDLVDKKITRGQFLEKYPGDIANDPSHLVQVLREALLDRYSDDVELSLELGFVFGFTANCSEVLCSLLDESWHHSHENIAEVMQDMKDPASIDALFRASSARFDYLDFDESFALAIKCVWALADIGTDAAIEKLRIIAETDDRIIVKKRALKRLGELT